MEKNWVLVTGASRGIGKAVALRLADDGYSIIVHYNSNEKAAMEVAKQIEQKGGSAQIMGFNVSDSAQIENKLDTWFKNMDGKFFGLVNNAGIHHHHPIDKVSYQDWQDNWQITLQTNLIGPANVCYCAAQYMILGS